MQHLTRTRRRTAASITGGIFLALITAAAAYYLATFVGAGGGSAPLGTASETDTLKLTAAVPSGLKPNQSATVVYMAKNEYAQPGTITRLFESVETSTGACNPEWFSLSAGTTPLTEGMTSSLTVPAKGEVEIGKQTLKFLETGTDESACSGATLTISLSSV